MIPEDWEVQTIRQIGTPVRGGSPRPAGDPKFFNGSYIPWLTVAALTNIPASQMMVTDTATCLTEEGSLHSRTLLPGTLIIANSGATLGVSKILGVKCCANDGIAALLNVSKHVSVKFCAHYINTKTAHLREVVATGNGQPNLNTELIGRFNIPFPPTKAEQDAIAEALSDTDALIESLEQLIAKKRHLKQGAMQELLTGKKRLPGFSGELEVKRLGELGEFLKGSGVRKDESFSGDLPCIRYGEIYTKHCNCIKTFHSWISPEVAATAKRLKRGDILFAGSGETKEEIGKCVAFVDDFEAYAGGDIVILRPENSCSTFLGYYLNTTPINQQKASKGQGDAVVHIGSAALSSIEIQIPPLPEQTAIAAILSDMDAEIAALETKLAKTRQLKQGMMHNLLTGKIRLVSATANIIVIPEQRDSVRTSTSSHNWQINEAVIIAVLAKHFGSEQYPLARKRCTKLTYLLHRHVERKAEGYLKKAAGPYNPATRYKGPEGIAQKNGYVRAHHNGTYQGFVAAANIGQAEDYFQEWYGREGLAWLEQFRLKKTDELELLTTVDMAMEDLHREGKATQVGTVKQVIHDHPEWIAKLRRELFSDINIARAMQTCRKLFA